MILEYSRPRSISEALMLLSREEPRSLPLAGGSFIGKLKTEDIALIDLQGLGLNKIEKTSGGYSIGAMATLSELEFTLKKEAFTEAIRIQASKNLRNVGTIGGLVSVGDGRSPFLTLLLALDAHLIWEPGKKGISLGNWLPIRESWKEGKLITKVIVPDAKVGFLSVGRTPKDKPILCCTIAIWPDGRMRVALGGFGKLPTLVLDGIVADDVAKATEMALKGSTDQWATSEYRVEAGKKMVLRVFNELTLQK